MKHMYPAVTMTMGKARKRFVVEGTSLHWMSVKVNAAIYFLHHCIYHIHGEYIIVNVAKPE